MTERSNEQRTSRERRKAASSLEAGRMQSGRKRSISMRWLGAATVSAMMMSLSSDGCMVQGFQAYIAGVPGSRATTTSRQDTQIPSELSPWRLHASRSDTATAVVQRKPRSSTSEVKREQAVQAMRRNKMEKALNGVDSQILELLSDDYLFPSNRRKKPKGRPDSVNAAMTVENMAKYRERQEVIEYLQKKKSSSPASLSELAAIALYLSAFEKPDSSQQDQPIRIEESLPSRPIKGEQATSLDSEASSLISSSSSKTKARKRVAKSLPKPRTLSEIKEDRERLEKSLSKGSKRANKVNGMDLHKYYRTKLLTSDEEYALGTKVNFLVQCERVHEGLASELMRLPTMQEWAAACGFVEEDPSFVAMEADEQLRPAGSDTMFEETDPNMFVGNSIARAAGPGRGRGRSKRPAPLTMKDFYDDSSIQAEMNQKGKTKKELAELEKKRQALPPVNRGTATDFIEMMMTAREAKQRMVQSNMRLVISIARKYGNVGVSVQDLVQEGSLGLSRACEKFEPKRGFKFSTYASWWIQQSVFRSIAYHSRTIRLPVHIHNLLNRVRKVRSALATELGRAPTNEEIAAKLNMSVKKYNKMIYLTKRSISLEVPKYQNNPKDPGHESQDRLGECIASSSLEDNSPEKSVDHGLFHEDIKQMLEILNEDERRVICARYGLEDGLTRTVTLVAAEMKESKSWVRSHECRALRKLRRPWYEQKLKEHQDALIA